MSLPPGTRLGPYEISALIGAGGMGEVYKARDMRLNRDVAIKVLPASFAADRERLRRFEQEAQAVAALSHPNILAIHDIGRHDGTCYLVSEFLDGESLRELLVRGIPSHRKSIAYAIQIAHALAATHSKNIAHRDLKPDNIFITRDGRVKVLDFGLAKSIAANTHHSASAADATMAEPGPVTNAGTVVGTAGYMSPEQVRGAAVDCRTDIFSFGAVLYEMLTGVRAFKRDTAVETMTAILNEDPPEVLAAGRQFPPALARTIHHCLEKSPEQRFQSARDLAFDLESATDLTPSGGLPAAKAAAEPRPWWHVAAAAAVLLLALALIGWKFSTPHPVTGSQFHQLTFRSGFLADARFTPDGQNVLYTAAWEGGKREIFTVPVNGNGGHSIGISNARFLAVSKQGEIAVALDPQRLFNVLNIGTLARTTTGSGAPKPEIENIQAADYNPDGSALAIVRYLPGKLLCQLEYPISKVLYSAGSISDLRFSPNGRYLAFITHDNPFDGRGTAVILRTNGEKVAASPLYESAQGLAWTPSGDEVWISSPLQSGAVHALSLSGKNREVLSVPGRLFLRDIAPDGLLLVTQGIRRVGIIGSVGNGSPQRDLSWLDSGYLRAISDDGQMILFEEEGLESPNYTVYVRNTDGSPAIPIGQGYGSALSHDKNWVVATNLKHEVWLMPVGPGEPRRLSPHGFSPSQFPGASFTADGKRVVYTGNQAGRPPRTWMQDIDGGGPRPISPENIVGYQVSPDDKWLLAGTASSASIHSTLVVPMDGGAPTPIAGLKPDEAALGWTSENRLFVSTYPKTGDTFSHIDKLDPRTGARTSFRDIPLLPLGGLDVVQLPLITPDGSSYAWGYRLSLSDLYTITGAR